MTRLQIMSLVDIIYDRKNGYKKAQVDKVEVHLTPEQEKKINDRIASRLKAGRVID